MMNCIHNWRAGVCRPKYIRFICAVLFVLVWCPGSAQQESMYSQYMFNMLQVNPAYAGFRGVSNITMLYRGQWTGVKGAPKTGSVTWDNLAPASNVGYGVNVYADKLGIETTSGFQGFFSYRLPLSGSYLSFGLSGGILNYRAMYADSELYTPGDPSFAQNENGWLPTAGFGILFVNEHMYAALSVPALLHTKINVQNHVNQNGFGADNHYFLSGGYNLVVSSDLKIKPSVMIKAVKGSPVQCDFNVTGWFSDVLGLGLSYRTNDALVGLFQLQISKTLRIGYSYDYGLSGFFNNKGSHEVFFRIELPRKDCPECRAPFEQ